MRIHFLLLVTFLAASSASAKRLIDARLPLHDPCLMKSLALMATDAADRRNRGAEVAAFLIVDADDRFAIVRWPSTSQVWRESFQGAIPEGAVAVVHTHPLEWDRPSRGDIREAMRIGLPFYIVSLWRIWVVDPVSGDPSLVGTAEWLRAADRDPCLRQRKPEQSTTERPTRPSPR